MDSFDRIMLWLNAFLDILAGDLAGGFYGWYFARNVLGEGYARDGACVGVLAGFVIAAALSLRYGAMSGSLKYLGGEDDWRQE